MHFWLVALALGVVALLISGCGGDAHSSTEAKDPDVGMQAPAGLAYDMTSSIYEVGNAIVANKPSASGGPIQRYAVAPPLPAGLSLDPETGIISGTPTAVATPAVYLVTAENAGGSATARVQIEVRSTPAAPAGLTYRETAIVYTVGQAIVANAPTSSGGPITSYSVEPALPAGLQLDTHTGVISGTPVAVASETHYTVTGTNATGSVTVVLRLAVQAAPIPPASLTYSASEALYVAVEAIVPNTPLVTGGTPSEFTVSPALPAGLSINAQTGAITGTPAAIQPQTTYTITASNSAGATQAQIRIAVTARGSWVAQAPVPVGRHYFPLVRLPSGKVMAIGGYTNAGPTDSVVVFDPGANSWTTAAPLSAARSEATATVLRDGRVLVVGGETQGRAALASAELYDPAQGTWQPAASMAETRMRHSATLLPDGKVLVIGGFDTSLTFRQTAERYDPITNTWTTMATPLAYARAQHGAELLPGGSTVLLIGGVNHNGYVTSAELFPVDDSGTTTVATTALAAANIYTSTRLADGSVLAMGDGSTTAFRFDPAASTWTISTFSGIRGLPTLTTLADGRVLLAGGTGPGGGRLATAEIYNPDFNTWTAANSMSTPRSGASAVLLDDGSTLVVGGFANSVEVDSVERYLP